MRPISGQQAWGLFPFLIFVLLLLLGCAQHRHAGGEAIAPPNVVLIFTDDQGYGDAGCYGAEEFRTPNLDRLAAEGVRFTDFYVVQPVCGASRAGLLTGCYPNRIGLLGAPSHRAKHGISDGEMTLAEVFKQKGYATAIYGKWHLGHHKKFLPTRHGFDEYFGLPYSNDMWPFHPTNPKGYPDLPLIENEEVIATNPDQTKLTGWYTERALRFIARNKDRPFFLYVPHNMPHVPLFASKAFKGGSKHGIYGDVIEEIDWSVGQILSALQAHDLDQKTLVIFASDNGPWLSYGRHAGSAGPLREGKGTTFEGGVRVPCIMRWPGQIPAGKVCKELCGAIDILPTIARLIDAKLPEHKIDGKDIWPLMARAPGAKSPHEAWFYYWGRHLQAVRSGKWKLHFPHGYRSLTGEPGKDGRPGGYSRQRIGLALFDLDADVGEQTDVLAQHPDVVARLKSLAEGARRDLGDSAHKRKGENLRPRGKL